MSRMTDQVGRVLSGRYRLVAPVGSGASAQVYLADDVRLRRRVAVKVLHPALAGDDAFLRRFRAEAQAAAALSHPHVLAVYDWGDDDGTTYLVTEYLSGGSLRAMLDSGVRLSTSQALLVGLEAARALDVAHRRGFVHRDIKPANLLFDRDGRLRVGDFGIARAVAEAAWTEPEGVLVGTARYAAPEQATAAPVDGRADVYALALTLVEAVTGEVPLVGGSPLATMALRQTTPVPVPDELGPLVEPLRRAGAADPDQRSNAEELVADLVAAATHLERPAPLPLPGLTATGPDAAAGDRTQVPPPTGRSDGDDRTAVLPTVVSGSGPAGDGRGGATVDPPAVDDAPTASLDVDRTTAPSAVREPRPEVDVPVPVPVSGAVDGPAVATATPRRRRRRWPWVLLVLVLVAGAAGGTWQYLRTRTPVHEVGAYVGGPIDEVRAAAVANGWVLVESVERRDGSGPGEVLDQDPAAGTSLEEGGALAVLVSEGQVLRAVPGLAGLPLADAEAALAGVELAVGVVDRQFDEEVPPDHVISASGVEGAELETGSPVDLVVSDGPEPRTVPEVAGSPVGDAVAALEALGLGVEVDEQHDVAVPEGAVVSVSPAAGEQVERGATVVVVASLGRPFITVPDVVGMGAAEASDRLEAAGFVVVDTIGPPNRPVLVTDPPAGETRRLGQAVTIVTRAT
jgi:eukaryotic-like serine/threonine-protein kinase